jgi:GDP-D-mannose dehydratase
MNKTAIVTGITGQMGSFFAEFLLQQGITVIGVPRRLRVPN